MSKVVSWQSDVHGQYANDLFFAREADHLLGTGGKWWAEMDSAYRHDGGEEVQEVVALIENALFEAGYTVEWDNGVHIYKDW